VLLSTISVSQLDIPRHILLFIFLDYKVVSVIRKIGNNKKGGHYVCHVRGQNDNEWIRIDDQNFAYHRKSIFTSLLEVELMILEKITIGNIKSQVSDSKIVSISFF
jgi:hypothetical protein